MRLRRASLVIATAAVAAGLGACGGGDERQDADEPEGTYRIEVVEAEFPSDQAIAKRATMRMVVRNSDAKAAPNVAVTVKTAPGTAGGAAQAFAQNRDDRDLADPSRPIWIVDRGPVGGETAYTNTWALGRLGPGETKTFEWRVTAVRAGDFTIDWSVSPGLDGRARAAAEAKGSFEVSIDDTPPDARVADDGKTVIREPGDQRSTDKDLPTETE